jgi:hypothetical protein
MITFSAIAFSAIALPAAGAAVEPWPEQDGPAAETAIPNRAIMKIFKVGIRSPRGEAQAQLRSTNAEFFDPKAMQLQTACSIVFRRPTSGT